MPDIQLRFHRDMLVLSSPIAPVLARQGFELDGDVEYATLMEPEAVECCISMTYDQYAKRFGRYFGGVVDKVFFDDVGYVSTAKSGRFR